MYRATVTVTCPQDTQHQIQHRESSQDRAYTTALFARWLTPSGAGTTASPKPATTTVDPFLHLPPYQLPKTGLLSILPPSIVPYAELMRLHKPAGYYAFLFPHLFGTLLAASSPTLTPIAPTPTTILRIILLHSISNLFLRGAACSYNDALDADYDRHVQRCRHRPVARRAVTPTTAHFFALAQSCIWISVLSTTPKETWTPAILLALTMAIYPFCKRWTNFPQVVLGFSLALGQGVGIGCLGVEVWSGRSASVQLGLTSVYLSNVVNAMVYDTVYAHQDIKDDLKTGVMSMAIACQGWTKQWLSLLSLSEIALLCVTGWTMEFQFLYWVLSVGGTAMVLCYMLYDWDVESPSDCWKWFCWTIWLTGGALCLGLAGECLGRV